jgi:hypothetical protein
MSELGTRFPRHVKRGSPTGVQLGNRELACMATRGDDPPYPPAARCARQTSLSNCGLVTLAVDE